jgi:NADPH:quinone reductase-like Zn-dependent oxidoreductase
VETLMPHAIQIQQTGEPEVVNWTPIEAGEPGPGQVRLRQAAAGLNYINVYHRTGYYSQSLPFIPGLEGPGTVGAIGQDVRGVKVGDRVAHAGPARWLFRGAAHRDRPTGAIARCDLLRSSSRDRAHSLAVGGRSDYTII